MTLERLSKSNADWELRFPLSIYSFISHNKKERKRKRKTKQKNFPSFLMMSNYLRFFLVTLILFAILLSGCTPSLRKDASQVAQAGSLLAKQMAEYYEILQKDTIDTYELNSFREAYLLQKRFDAEVADAQRNNRPVPRPPSFAMSDTDKEIFKEYQKTYQALATRIKLARAMQTAYSSYSRLAEYDAAKEVGDSLDNLLGAVKGAAIFPLPDPTNLVGNLVQGIFSDLIRELETIKQNKKLLRESNRLVPILIKLKQIFDAERILYGGDTEVTDSNGVRRKISGIAGRNAAAYKSTARQLVESDAVISTALVNRVLGKYGLRFPEPQVAFSQPALKAGIVKMIESRAFPLAQLSEDVGEKISTGLGALVTLHNQLAEKKPISLQAIIENSATAEVLLDQLKAQDIDPNLLKDLIKLLEGEKK